MRPRWTAALLAAIAVAVAAGLGRRAAHSRGVMPDIRLAALGTGATVALNSCPTPTCLTVYVSPWCPHCRRSGPVIKAVAQDARRRGITARVIVGNDSEKAVRAYAAHFGAGTLLDPGALFSQDGVPTAYVSDAQGRIQSKIFGLPESTPPDDLAKLREIERRDFGLP